MAADTLTLTAQKPSPCPVELSLRPAVFSDAPLIAHLYAAANYTTGTGRFLAPQRFSHWSDWTTWNLQRTQSCLLSPEGGGFLVALSKGGEDVPIGQAMYSHRYSQGARGRESWFAWARRLLNAAAWRLHYLLWGNHAVSSANLAFITGPGTAWSNQYWGQKVFGERVHCVSCMVLPEYERRGAGKALMEAVVELGRQRGVPVALESSPQGFRLYEKMGFRMIEKYPTHLVEDEDVGGLMAWFPEEWDAEEVLEEVRAEGRKGGVKL